MNPSSEREALYTLIRGFGYTTFSQTWEIVDAIMERAALSTQPQQAGWMPIETAPKDGTHLLLMSRKGRIADGCWVDANGRYGFWAWSLVLQEPTHWMPLPPVPGQEGIAT